jgi:RNA polymerase sigma factor (sigma-70 family)
MRTDYKGLFQDWEIAVAKNLVNDFRRRQTCLQREGFEDLLQECLIHWLFVRGNYDSTREVSPQTFMGRIVRNKLTDIIREKQADKRKVAHLTISLDIPLEDDSNSPTLIEKLNDNATIESCSDPRSQADLRIDLEKVLQKLSPKQKEICHLLGDEGFSVKEASNRTGMPRSTVYDEIERIRKIFLKEGLNEYLR